jgi:phage tail sheath gpL-like
MAINFTFYPESNRVPGVFVEMDPSQANTARTFQRSLVLGQITDDGDAPPLFPLQVNTLTQIQAACGRGSMLAMMAHSYRTCDPFGDLWILPYADSGTAAAAVGSITFAGSNAASNGTLFLYIAGMPVRCGIAEGDTPAAIATKLLTALDNLDDLPVTATRALGVVTLTAKNKGLSGNSIDVRLNYYGAAGGEWTPPGPTITIVQPTGGTGNPLISDGLANLSDQNFDFIVTPYTDTPNLDAMKIFLDDATGRWSWEQMLYGGAFSAYRGSFSQCVNFGLARNDQHTSVMPYNNSPDPPWVWAAQIGAFASASLRVDPGLPLQYIGTYLKAPPVANRWAIGERNTLLYSGLSSFRVADDGTVVIDRMTTTYQKNPAGTEDDSYLDVETMYGLMYVARDLARYLVSKYARKKLVSDQTPILPGSNSVNAPMIKASTIAEYRVLEANGFVQNSRNFARDIVVENAGRGLVKILAPVDLVNQLRQIAILLQFRKS